MNLQTLLHAACLKSAEIFKTNVEAMLKANLQCLHTTLGLNGSSRLSPSAMYNLKVYKKSCVLRSRAPMM